MDSFDFDYIDALPTVRVGFARMTQSPVKETKSKPAIVFVHGNMQGAWIYSNWLKVVHEAGIAATAVDVRGHGGLPTEDLLTAGLSEYGDDVAAIARTFEHPPVLAGHSMGGVMVGVAASRTPVAGLILLTPSRRPIFPALKLCLRLTRLAPWRLPTKKPFAKNIWQTTPITTSRQCLNGNAQKVPLR